MKLSIIMPLYNSSKTLSAALDSVLMQSTTFEYEIICIDDYSLDNTYEILTEYAEKYSFITILKNDKNMGNGPTFVRALKLAQGDYFAVLDGDDFYTVKYKLQRQVDFLDNDKDEEFCAVCHEYLTVYSDGRIAQNCGMFSGDIDYSYSEMLYCKFYSHTSTYMYRNIFKEKLSPFFDIARGDLPRLFVLSNYTRGKVRKLNFVGSVYNYSNDGIWSKLGLHKQHDMNNKFWLKCIDFASSSAEKKILNKQIVTLGGRRDVSAPHRLATWTMGQCFEIIKMIASKYAFDNSDFVFARSYKSELLDSFSETLGRIELNSRGMSPLSQVTENNNIAISIASLNAQGGGVYNEIKEIIELNYNKNIFMIFSDVASREALDSKIEKDLSLYPNITMLFCSEQGDEKLKKLFDILLSINVCKVYHYSGHNFPYNAALIQQGIYKNIMLFSMDHGFALSLDNSSMDCYIARTPNQYAMLSKRYGHKVIHVPVMNKEIQVDKMYTPFNNHQMLITATAAATYYEFDNNIMSYSDFVVELLKKSRGVHYHYGPIPEADKIEIYEKLKNNSISNDSFVHSNWSHNLCQELLDNNVDLFVASFPVGSSKTLINVYSVGIPVICYRGEMRIHCSDYVFPDALIWSSFSDFVEQISALTRNSLMKISIEGKKYYHKNNSFKNISAFFCNEKHVPIDLPTVYCRDTRVLDVKNDPYFFPIGLLAEKTTSFLPLDFNISIKNCFLRKKYRIKVLSKELVKELIFYGVIRNFKFYVKNKLKTLMGKG